MRRVLVTGGTGYIGGHLARSLRLSGDRVRCLVRCPSRAAWMEPSDLELSQGDLGDYESLRRAIRNCDVVYHLAGMTSARTARSLFEVNARGTHHLARACADQTTPPLLVIVSSLAAAGTSPAWGRQSEVDRPRPISNYGRSKRAGELAAAAWSDHVPISIVRPGIVFGPGNRELLPMFQMVERLMLYPAPGFAAKRLALIHHDDLINAIQAIVDRGQRINGRVDDHHRSTPNADGGGYYFASAPEFPTYQQLGRMIGRALRKRTLILQCAEPFVWLTAAGNELASGLRGKPDSFNIDKIREAFAGQWTNSCDRLQSELRFFFPRSLQERMHETAKWYRENRWL